VTEYPPPNREAERGRTSSSCARSSEQVRRPPEPYLGSTEALYPNWGLCKIVVDCHRRCWGETAVAAQQISAPCQIYFLERALSRLHTVAVDDYKRAYTQCSNKWLKVDEKRRLLDYCRTRSLRWKPLVISHSRMLRQLQDSMPSESGPHSTMILTSSECLQLLIQQIEDQLQKTDAFLTLQLDHIAADQQRELMHNQIKLSEVQIAESRKAIQQTETMRKLTILAFIFIPTSTICSFFGMNIKELDNHPQLWVFFVTLIIVVSVILAVATADDMLTLMMRLIAAVPALPRGGEPDISFAKRWTAIITFEILQTPFALAWKATRAIARRWKLYIWEGRQYRAGYTDPSRSEDTQAREGNTEAGVWMQKGAVMSKRLTRTFENYARLWRELWEPSKKARTSGADPWSAANIAIPPPSYVNGHAGSRATNLGQSF
jgi:CorA-like Mg2+ transporter protein